MPFNTVINGSYMNTGISDASYYTFLLSCAILWHLYEDICVHVIPKHGVYKSVAFGR